MSTELVTQQQRPVLPHMVPLGWSYGAKTHITKTYVPDGP